MFSLHSMHYNL